MFPSKMVVFVLIAGSSSTYKPKVARKLTRKEGNEKKKYIKIEKKDEISFEKEKYTQGQKMKKNKSSCPKLCTLRGIEGQNLRTLAFRTKSRGGCRSR